MIKQHGPNHYEAMGGDGKSLGHFNTKEEAMKAKMTANAKNMDSKKMMMGQMDADGDAD